MESHCEDAFKIIRTIYHEKEAKGGVAVATRYSDTDVKCPFYAGGTERAIICEGVLKSADCRSGFKSKKQKEAHFSRCCQDKYKTCKLYCVLDSKYNDKGEEA